MPLSWNEIRNRAHEFSRRWDGEESERAESQSFWGEFFEVFGVDRNRVAFFEKQVSMTGADSEVSRQLVGCFGYVFAGDVGSPLQVKVRRSWCAITRELALV